MNSHRLASRGLAFVTRIRSRRSQLEKPALLIAGLAFVLGLAVAVRALDVALTEIRWYFLIVAAAIGVPAMMTVNALEVTIAGRSVGLRIPLGDGFRIGVLGTAANLLPLPGAVLVRTADLISRGAKGTDSTRAQLAIGLLWNSASALAVGLVAITLPIPWAPLWWTGGAAFLIVGVLALPHRSTKFVARVLIVEAGSVAITALRLLCIFLALDIQASYAASLAIAAANSLSALVWIFPSGLAIREALGSGFAAMVGVPGPAGFAAYGIDRILGLIVHLGVLPFIIGRSSLSGLADKSPVLSRDGLPEISDGAG